MKNLKFDIKRSDEEVSIGQDGYRVIIAGSTHTGEDEIILKVFKEKLAKYTENRLAEESGEASEWNASIRKKIKSLQTKGYNVAEMYDQNNQLHYTTYDPKKMTKEQAEAKLEKRWGSISSEVAEKN